MESISLFRLHASDHHIQGRRKNFYRFRMTANNLTINHHADRFRQLELYPAGSNTGNERVFHMGTTEDFWESSHEIPPSNGSHAGHLHQAICGIGVRRNHQFPSRETTVGKG